jgi:ubiquinol-cytochrome c reductase cytochrome b subunit
MSRRRGLGRGGVVRRSIDAVAGRVGGGHGVNKALRKVFPNHFSFLWGELALYSFVVLVITGVYLTFPFEASQEIVVYDGSYEPLRDVEMSAAYESTLRISQDTRGGLLVRQIHHWAALVFVAAIVLHLCRVFFTGAFRRPRDLNWVVGCALLVLALATGFTGYSLPDDLLSGTGLRITHGIMLSIPFVGEQLTLIVFGDEWPGDEVIGRLYPVHILILPVSIAALVGIHLAMVWRQKHTQFPGPGRTEDNVVGERVWPGFAMKSIGLLFLTSAVLAAMGALVTVNPIWLFGPYEPAAATSYAQPDWYVGFLEGALRLYPPWEPAIAGVQLPNPFVPAVALPTVMFAVLFAVPWIERRFTRDDDDHHLLDRPRDAERRTASGVAALTFVVVLFVAAAQDIVAEVLHVSIGRVTTVLQVAVLVAPAIAWWITWRLCLSLQRRPAPERTERAEIVARDGGGGYRGVHLDGELDHEPVVRHEELEQR